MTRKVGKSKQRRAKSSSHSRSGPPVQSKPRLWVRESTGSNGGKVHSRGPKPTGTAVADERPSPLPPLPPADPDGHFPAGETLQVLLARLIIERRHKAGLTQAQLATEAGIRPETVSRLETGKHAPNLRTVEKVEAALQRAGV